MRTIHSHPQSGASRLWRCDPRVETLPILFVERERAVERGIVPAALCSNTAVWSVKQFPSSALVCLNRPGSSAIGREQ